MSNLALAITIWCWLAVAAYLLRGRPPWLKAPYTRLTDSSPRIDEPQSGAQETKRPWLIEGPMLLAAQLIIAIPVTQMCLPKIPSTRPDLHFLSLCLAHWLTYLGLRWMEFRGSRLILPTVCLLNGLGWLCVFRLDPHLGHRQCYWIIAGLMLYLGVSIMLRDYRLLWKARWLCLLAAVLLQFGLLFVGVERNGAQLWYSLGRINFQPVEFVKLLILIFLVSCLTPLASTQDLQAKATSKPVIQRSQLALFFLCWAVSELTLAGQRDLGMALLFFGVFLALFYEATGRTRWVGAIILSAVFGATACYWKFSHIQVRFQAWWNPWPHADGTGYQLTQGLFSMAAGGWLGTGIGAGQPWMVPEAATDFIFTAMVEELGSICGLAIIVAQALLFLVITQASRGPRDPFARLLLIGIGVTGAWQTIIVLFGILQLAPMTGLTLPFVSYGGSSVVASFVALGIAQRLTQPDLYPEVVEFVQTRKNPSYLLRERRLQVIRLCLTSLLILAGLKIVVIETAERPSLTAHALNQRQARHRD